MMKPAASFIETVSTSSDSCAHSVAEQLADCLSHAMPKASTIVSLKDPVTGDHHYAQRASDPADPDLPDLFLMSRKLKAPLPLTFVNLLGMNVIAVPIGTSDHASHNGFLAACSHDKNFPTPRDSAVLKMAAAAHNSLKSLSNPRLAQQDLLPLAQQQNPVNQEDEQSIAADLSAAPSQYMRALATLAAGLSHDLGNLLLPIRLRLASIETQLAESRFTSEFSAIRSCLDSIQRLTHGLELFALDPSQATGASDLVSLHDWWNDVEPFLRSALPHGIPLHADFPRNLPLVHIAPHWLAQVTLNLVQNAGEALASCANGAVTIWAKPGSGGKSITIGISDNGPGMSDEIRARCFEPFFTTKTRAISTGLGLSLVHGIIRRANGTIDLQSAPGRGVTILLNLPAFSHDAALHAPQHANGPSRGSNRRLSRNLAKRPTASHRAVSPADAPRHARVSVQDVRVRGFITTFLQALGFTVDNTSNPPGDDITIWVTDHAQQAQHHAEAFLTSKSRSIIMLGDAKHLSSADRFLVLADKPDRASLTRALRQCAHRAQQLHAASSS